MRRVLGLMIAVIAAVFLIFGGASGRLPSMVAAILAPSALS